MKIGAFSIALAGLLNGFAVLPVTARRPPQTTAASPPPEQFTRVCGKCHTAERTVDARRSRDQWQEVIDNMMTRGAEATDDDLAVVMKYLVSRHGRVNINRDVAAELVEVLAIPAADAQKIVDYRKAHGRIEDMAALEKIPGIDVEKLKAQREAIVF